MGTIQSGPTHGRWYIRDYIIVSAGLLDARGFNWPRRSTEIIQHDYQMYVPDTPGAMPIPSRSIYRNRLLDHGFSDHLPVACRLRLAR